MYVGQKCGSCKRPMRPEGSTREDWPNTVMYKTHGLCTSCNKARVRGDLPGPRKPRGVMPDQCRDCRRPLRHPSVMVRDAPGTVSYGGHGVCTRCARNPGKPVQGYRMGVVPCRGCEHPTRPSREKIADYPGTRVRRKQGFCSRCVDDGTATEVLAMAANVTAWRARLKTT